MLNQINSTDVYTDFTGLANLKTEAKQKTPEAIKEVAKQFESIFLGMMVKGMRAAKLTEGSIMDNDQSKFYQDMYDQQLSVSLAGDPGIGLATLIEKQLSPQVYKNQDILGIHDYQAKPVQRQRLNSIDTSVKLSAIEKPLVTTAILTSKEAFVHELRIPAQQAAKALGVDANALLAQAALETGWGKSVIKMADGRSSFNLFNIKAHSNWTGKHVTKNTLEFDGAIARQEQAQFRAYDSYQESFNDYVRFIKDNPRYQQAVKQSGNVEQYMQALQTAGYATDPAYKDKVMRIYQDKVLSGVQHSVVNSAKVQE